MTEKEIERLAELIAIKTNERYLQIAKKLIDEKIEIHEFRCEAGKFSKLMGIICAAIGGAIVTLFNWFLRKYE